MKKENNKVKNFIDVEDLLLARVNVHLTVDSINGTDQKASTFWDKVFAQYVEAWGQENLDVELGSPEERGRTADSLRVRWKKTLESSCRLWARSIKGTPKPSGISPADYEKKCHETYETRHNSKFKFKEVWDIVSNLPKFAIGASDSSDIDTSFELSTSDNDSDGVLMIEPKRSYDLTSKMEAPDGSKKVVIGGGELEGCIYIG